MWKKNEVAPVEVMMAYIPLQSFLTLAPDGGGWSASRYDRLSPRKQQMVGPQQEARRGVKSSPIQACTGP